MATKINEKEFKFIQDLSWEDVFDLWRKGEENLEHWIEFYKAKNFNSCIKQVLRQLADVVQDPQQSDARFSRDARA